MRDFSRTLEALDVWDEEKTERSARWDKIECDQDLDNVLIMEDIEKDRVRWAFWQDTKDINSREICYIVNPETIRGLINGSIS